MKSYQIGQFVKYVNGSDAIYIGEVVKVNSNGLVVIDPTDKAEMELWNAGYAVGSCISISQVEAATRIENEAEVAFFKSHPELNP